MDRARPIRLPAVRLENFASGVGTAWVKRFSSARCDWLFVVVGDGRCWFIPAKMVQGSAHITLGGPKYAEFEVEPGRPLPVETAS